MDKILRCTVLQHDSPSAAADRGRDVLVRRGGSEKNDPSWQPLALSCFENLNPCQAGHQDVEDGDVGFECADRLEGSGPVALLVDDVKTGNSSQECLKPAQDDGVVVREQNAQRAAAVHHAGNSMLISEPCGEIVRNGSAKFLNRVVLQVRVHLGGALSGRDTNAFNKTVSGLLKLVYPDAEHGVPDEELVD